MKVIVKGIEFDVNVRIHAGVNWRVVTAINIETKEHHFFDTIDNPITKKELQEFLEKKLIQKPSLEVLLIGK